MIPFITTMHQVQITIQTDEVRRERGGERRDADGEGRARGEGERRMERRGKRG